MSISHDSASTIVCKEVFDENSQPSEKEVLDYARRLGIDPESEPYLLDLAREGLMAALPKGWMPVYDNASKTFYYYQRSTNVTTWEHPLNVVYKDLVAQARASNRRRASVEEDTKPDGEANPSGLPPPIPAPLLKSPSTRIPTKLAPLKRHRSESSSGLPRRGDNSLDRLTRGWKSGDSDPEGSTRSSLSDRTSRDYTNLRFQDPEFYESPKLLETGGKSQLHIRDVLKRSESLSPRHEKDWQQLSGRFSSEENMIDIDALRAKSLGAKPRTPENLEMLPPLQLPPHQHPKELTLSGGGAIFLKSNRSRDTTPCHEEKKPFEEPGAQAEASGLTVSGVADEMTASAGERLKSILREKANEDDDRPMDEERKSVRFDLQKVAIQTAVTKFNDSGSDDEETDEEDRVGGIASILAAKRAANVLSLQQVLNRQGGPSFESTSFIKKIEVEPKKTTVVGRRFVVENVSEKEHLQQQEDKSLDIDDESIPNKFENIKNIDLVSKSDSERTTPRSTDSSFMDELRRKKEMMMERMRKADIRSKFIDDAENKPATPQSPWTTKMLRTLELSRDGTKSPSSENSAVSIENLKENLAKDHEQELHKIEEEYQARVESLKKHFNEKFNKEKQTLEAVMQERLSKLKKELVEKEEQEVQKLKTDMNEARAENLKKVKTDLEVCYEKERQDILANLKSELDQRKRELLELRSQEILKLESEHEKELDEERQAKLSEMEIMKQHNERSDNLKKELDKEFDNLRTELRAQQREKITKITEDHEKCLADILRDFRVDEALARKVYKQRLEEIRSDYSKDVENEMKKQNESSAVRQESVDFEKIRCEKRLLEDKYNTLKEKYLKLKKDMRAAVEKRNRRKEQQAAAANTTTSETEISTSARTRTERTESTDQKSPLTKTNSISNSKPKEVSGQNPNALREQQQQQQQQQPDPQQQQRVVITTTTATSAAAAAVTRFESDDTTTCSETTSNLLMMSKQKKKVFTKKPTSGANKINNNIVDNPVENIRKQLEKLEDLGDQLPSNETAYTVRYPFQDKSPTNMSSELEFFRHRIHVERDSVKRAREALRQQRSAFQSRQRAWKQRSARATLEQLVKEERELSDMEVSLHRTRSLLGEKVIHLRHLEQSLERVANSKRLENENAAASAANKSDEMTLSDMSSASSGFSSTDLGTDTFIESTEIIASLENLNSEIREIWGVLNKRQDNSIPPPPTLMYTDLSWFPYQHLSQPATVPAAFGTPNIQSNILSQLTAAHPPGATQNIIAQYGPTSGYTTSVGTVEGAATSNLIERTRNLKDWLRQARVETSDLVSPGQATL